MSERGPVGGAGELTAHGELAELVRRMESEEQGKLWGYGTILEYCKDRLAKLKKLAAKAPQGVPATHGLAEAIANELMSQNMLDVTVQQAMFPIKRVLESALTGTRPSSEGGGLAANPGYPAPESTGGPQKMAVLPVSGPVSDDTIHHGMGPPLAVSKLADEVNQCLQIILTNAGNIKQDRQGPIFEDCLAIEEAVERASKATWAALRGDSNGKP